MIDKHQEHRDVLVISPLFPPSGDPRAIQVNNLVSYLASVGLSVDVVCEAQKASFESINSHLPNAVPDCEGLRVIRYSKPNLSRNATALKVHRLVYPFDPYGHYRPLFHAVRSTLLRRRYRLILSVSEPLVSHRVTLRLLRLAPSAKVVFIYGDPVPTLDAKDMMKLRIRRRICQRIAFESARIGTLCVAPTEEILEPFRSAPESTSRCRVVPHCFNPSCWPYPEQTGPVPQTLTLLHAGALYYRRSPEPLIRACEILARDGGQSIHWRLVGPMESRMRPLVQESACAHMIRVEPGQTYAESRELIRSSDILCIIDCALDRNVHLPSKVADYVAACRPILYVGQPASPTCRLLEPLHPAFRQAQTPPQIARAITELASARRSVPIQDYRRAYTALSVASVWSATIRELT